MLVLEVFGHAAIFRFGRSYGTPSMADSCIEGCAWSVLACNVLFSPLALRVTVRWPRVTLTLFIDDSTLRSGDEDVYQLRSTATSFHQFDTFSGAEEPCEEVQGFWEQLQVPEVGHGAVAHWRQLGE